MAYDTTAIETAYLDLIATKTTWSTVKTEWAKSLVSRLVSAMTVADSQAESNVQSYSIAGRSVTYKSGSSSSASTSTESAEYIKLQLDRMLGLNSMVSLNNLGGAL